MLRALSIGFLFLMLSAAAPSAGAESFGDYPDPEGMYREIYDLQERFPDFAQVEEYGESVQGRPLLYLRIARPGGGGLPQAMVAANIHGNEWIGNRMAMAIARRLLEDSEKDPWVKSLLDNMQFFILPCMNPDGYYRTWESRNEKNVKWPTVRKNANGVDLNRNFPLPAERTIIDSWTGSDEPGDVRYKGPHPYSEPETIAIRDFVAARKIFASIDFHSNWGTIFPPKCNSAACEKQFKKMLAPAIEKQKVKYAGVQSRQVDSFSGEMEDAMFYDFGIMAVCWEIFPMAQASEQKKRLKHRFWSMNPEDIAFWVENDRDAALAALEKAYRITGGKPVPEKFRKAE